MESPLSWTATRVLKEPWDVDRRVAELGLTKQGLLQVRDIAFAEANNATPNHCANAAGTFSYQYGTLALRQLFQGPLWVVDRANGVEAILHRMLDIRVAYQNIDSALDDNYQPKPRTAKGSGSERLCEPNLFGMLPHFARRDALIKAVYYLMVDERGACELSCPIVQDGAFKGFVERIYLSDGSDFGGVRRPLDEDDAVTDFDPIVERKS